jgi:MFS family permease
VGPTAVKESSLRYPGWRVVVACFTMALFAYGFGLYGHGVYLAELTMQAGPDAPKLTATTVSAATTVYYLLSALLVVFVSDAIARLGPRIVTTVGALTLTLSLLLVSRIKSPIDLFIAYVTMSIAWATLTNATITNILGLWFAEKRGLAISLSLNGAGAGGIIITPLLVWMIGCLSFETAMQIVAVATLPILLMPILLWIGRPPEGLRIASGRGTPSGVPVTRRGALGTAHFWTIAAPFALGFMAQVGFLVHQVAFLLPSLGREGASLAVALTMSVAVICRVGVGFFIDRLDQRHVAALLLTLQATALFVMSQSITPTVLYVACALFGVAVSSMITLPALITQREYPAHAFGTLSALLVAIIQLTHAFGPGLLGWLRDVTGGYSVPLAVCMALQLTAAAIVLLRIGPARLDANNRRPNHELIRRAP